MDWIFAGFGFALGMWVFVTALRLISRHRSILWAGARWTVLALVPLVILAAGFSTRTKGGIITAIVALGIFGGVVSSLTSDAKNEPVISQSHEP